MGRGARARTTKSTARRPRCCRAGGWCCGLGSGASHHVSHLLSGIPGLELWRTSPESPRAPSCALSCPDAKLPLASSSFWLRGPDQWPNPSIVLHSLPCLELCHHGREKGLCRVAPTRDRVKGSEAGSCELINIQAPDPARFMHVGINLAEPCSSLCRINTEASRTARQRRTTSLDHRLISRSSSRAALSQAQHLEATAFQPSQWLTLPLVRSDPAHGWLHCFTLTFLSGMARQHGSGPPTSRSKPQLATTRCKTTQPSTTQSPKGLRQGPSTRSHGRHGTLTCGCNLQRRNGYRHSLQQLVHGGSSVPLPLDAQAQGPSCCSLVWFVPGRVALHQTSAWETVATVPSRGAAWSSFHAVF